MDVFLYFRVHGIAKDEKGDPIAAGLSIKLGESENPPSYEVLSGNLTGEDIGQLMTECGFQGLFDPSNVELITPEEYEAEFGDKEGETDESDG